MGEPMLLRLGGWREDGRVRLLEDFCFAGLILNVVLDVRGLRWLLSLVSDARRGFLLLPSRGADRGNQLTCFDRSLGLMSCRGGVLMQ